eukprot:315892-Pyramimonas_sp.AAC.1
MPAGASMSKWGYAVSDLCPHCGERDTVRHRCWTCTCRPAVVARKEHFCQELVDQALAAGPESCLFSRLWAPFPDLPEPAQDWGFRFFEGEGVPCEPFRFQLEDTLFTDGSCFHGGFPAIARAGLAVVHMDGERPVRGIYGPLLKEFAQQAADAEHAGLAVAILRTQQEEAQPKPIS